MGQALQPPDEPVDQRDRQAPPGQGSQGQPGQPEPARDPGEFDDLPEFRAAPSGEGEPGKLPQRDQVPVVLGVGEGHRREGTHLPDQAPEQSAADQGHRQDEQLGFGDAGQPGAGQLHLAKQLGPPAVVRVRDRREPDVHPLISAQYEGSLPHQREAHGLSGQPEHAGVHIGYQRSQHKGEEDQKYQWKVVVVQQVHAQADVAARGQDVEEDRDPQGEIPASGRGPFRRPPAPGTAQGPDRLERAGQPHGHARAHVHAQPHIQIVGEVGHDRVHARPPAR